MILDPLETMATRDWLAFAQIPAPSVAMIGREQQFAEKVHAYTLPRSYLNSRVRDLVDLYLLVESDSLDLSRTGDALRRTFERRDTHEIPVTLTPPPPDWERPFHALAEECRIEIGHQAAFAIVLRSGPTCPPHADDRDAILQFRASPPVALSRPRRMCSGACRMARNRRPHFPRNPRANDRRDNPSGPAQTASPQLTATGNTGTAFPNGVNSPKTA